MKFKIEKLVRITLKPAVHDAYFPAEFLAESCHRIGCDTGTNSIAANIKR